MYIKVLLSMGVLLPHRCVLIDNLQLFKAKIQCVGFYRSILFSLFRFDRFAEMKQCLINIFGASVLLLLCADTIEGGTVQFMSEKGYYHEQNGMK